MEIVLASRNKKKIGELNTLLSENLGDKVNVLSLDDVGYTGDIEEDGNSFWQNAVIKACAPAALGYIGVADDSGLCVDSLGGAPGIYSARFSGEGATDAKNNEKLLLELENETNRSASFQCHIAIVIPKKLGISVPASMISLEAGEYVKERYGMDCNVCIVSGKCKGTILRASRGEGGFGYDPLFYVEEKDKTFSELTPCEKNEISHRGNAMRAFSENINQLIKENNI